MMSHASEGAGGARVALARVPLEVVEAINDVVTGPGLYRRQARLHFAKQLRLSSPTARPRLLAVSEFFPWIAEFESQGATQTYGMPWVPFHLDAGYHELAALAEEAAVGQHSDAVLRWAGRLNELPHGRQHLLQLFFEVFHLPLVAEAQQTVADAEVAGGGAASTRMEEVLATLATEDNLGAPGLAFATSCIRFAQGESTVTAPQPDTEGPVAVMMASVGASLVAALLGGDTEGPAAGSGTSVLHQYLLNPLAADQEYVLMMPENETNTVLQAR